MESTTARRCLREPIPEIADAARYLDAAVSAHLTGRFKLAEELIRLADMTAIRDWSESIWGAKSPYVQYRAVPTPLASLPKEFRAQPRDATSDQKRALHERDGYHCRFCGIPVIRAEVRKRIVKAYPAALRWGEPGKHAKNAEQHFAFQAMCAQYDHIVPHSREGGKTHLENLIVTCWPCNCGRMERTLDEVGLIDPRLHDPIRSTWDGLERFR
jgi:5-methylcytosine-specific restriction endonuclease McrA